MKRAAIIAAISLFVLAMNAEINRAQNHAPTIPPVRWEYGKISRFTDTSVDPHQHHIAWLTRNSDVGVEGYDMALAANLGDKVNPKDENSAHPMELFDFLGDQGWEYVGQWTDPGDIGATTILFKRAK